MPKWKRPPAPAPEPDPVPDPTPPPVEGLRLFWVSVAGRDLNWGFTSVGVSGEQVMAAVERANTASVPFTITDVLDLGPLGE